MTAFELAYQDIASSKLIMFSPILPSVLVGFNDPMDIEFLIWDANILTSEKEFIKDA